MTPKCTAIATAFENRKVTNDVILVIGDNLEIPFTTAKIPYRRSVQRVSL